MLSAMLSWIYYVYVEICTKRSIQSFVKVAIHGSPFISTVHANICIYWSSHFFCVVNTNCVLNVFIASCLGFFLISGVEVSWWYPKSSSFSSYCNRIPGCNQFRWSGCMGITWSVTWLLCCFYGALRQRRRTHVAQTACCKFFNVSLILFNGDCIWFVV